MKNLKPLLFLIFLSVLFVSACRPEIGAGTKDTTDISKVSEARTEASSKTSGAEATTIPSPSPTPPVDLSVFAIQPQYSYAENFSDDGYAVVYINSDPDNIDCLIIDMNGSAVFGPVDWIFLDESPNLSPFYENGKYGYINSNFEVVIEPEYDVARRADEDGCYTVAKDGKWGRIDQTNQWVCPPQFEGLEGYYSDGSTGFIKFFENGAWGVADRFGNIILDPEYSFIGFPNEDLEYGLPEWYPNKTGLFMICTGKESEKSGLADKYGGIVFEPSAEWGFCFADNGLSSVMINGKAGYINTKGEMVIEPQFGWGGTFSEQGLARVSLASGENAFIDETGTILDPETVEAMGVFEYAYEGVSFGIKDGVTGLYDAKGNCLFDSQGYEPYLNPVYHGTDYYLFVYEDKSILLDIKGKVTAEYPFIVEYYFSKENKLIFPENGKYGVMDTDGNRLIEPAYDRIYGDWNTNDHEGGRIINFSNRELVMTAVYDNYSDSGGYGILSADGVELLPPINPNYIIVSANGMVPFQVGDLYGYIRIDVG